MTRRTHHFDVSTPFFLILRYPRNRRGQPAYEFVVEGVGEFREGFYGDGMVAVTADQNDIILQFGVPNMGDIHHKYVHVD